VITISSHFKIPQKTSTIVLVSVTAFLLLTFSIVSVATVPIGDEWRGNLEIFFSGTYKYYVLGSYIEVWDLHWTASGWHKITVCDTILVWLLRGLAPHDIGPTEIVITFTLEHVGQQRFVEQVPSWQFDWHFEGKVSFSSIPEGKYKLMVECNKQFGSIGSHQLVYDIDFHH